MQNIIRHDETILNSGVVLDSYHAAAGIPDINKMTREQFDTELGKGYKDVLEGRIMPAKQVFAEIRNI